MAVLRNFNFEPLGQSVDDGRADAVQTAGDLVAVAAELILDADNIAREYLNIDIRAEARESFVYGVVDYLIHKVVQAARTRRADVHTGALADRLKSLKNLNLARVVFLGDPCIHILVELNILVEHGGEHVLFLLFLFGLVLRRIFESHSRALGLREILVDLDNGRDHVRAHVVDAVCEQILIVVELAEDGDGYDALNLVRAVVINP